MVAKVNLAIQTMLVVMMVSRLRRHDHLRAWGDALAVPLHYNCLGSVEGFDTARQMSNRSSLELAMGRARLIHHMLQLWEVLMRPSRRRLVVVKNAAIAWVASGPVARLRGTSLAALYNGAIRMAAGGGARIVTAVGEHVTATFIRY